jgi:hypothetical protein
MLEQSVDGRMILNLILREEDVRIWIAFDWLRVDFAVS